MFNAANNGKKKEIINAQEEGLNIKPVDYLCPKCSKTIFYVIGFYVCLFVFNYFPLDCIGLTFNIKGQSISQHCFWHKRRAGL